MRKPDITARHQIHKISLTDAVLCHIRLHKGQISIPKALRGRLRLQPGQAFTIESTTDGALLLRPAKPVPKPVSLDEVVGCLRYAGPPKTLEEMEAAIAQGAREREHVRC